MGDEELMKVRGIGGSGFLKRDISIPDSELTSSINLPEPFILDKESFVILYKGHVYTLSSRPSHINYINLYTRTYGLEESVTPRELESVYFQKNEVTLNQLKKEFLERVTNSVSLPTDVRDLSKEMFGKQIANEIIRKINRVYSNSISEDDNNDSTTRSRRRRTRTFDFGHFNRLNDGSILNTELTGFDRVLKLDNKLYDLVTIPEYLSKFHERGKIDPSFYRSLESMSRGSTPEEIAENIKQNKEMISDEKTYRVMKDKIWSSVRSDKIHLDGTYFIPEFRGPSDELINPYKSLIEKRLKFDAARTYSTLMGDGL